MPIRNWFAKKLNQFLPRKPERTEVSDKQICKPKFFQYKWILVLLTGTCLFFSCQEKIFTDSVDCKECYATKPDSVDLVLNLTINDQFDTVPVLLYQGKIDDGQFIDTFYCYKNPANIYVKANEEYSAIAIYSTDKRTVKVVDGTKQKLKHVTGACNPDCWVITGEKLFLQLH